MNGACSSVKPACKEPGLVGATGADDEGPGATGGILEEASRVEAGAMLDEGQATTTIRKR